MKKKALVTGVTGMDGSHISQILLEKGYNVYGMWRRGATDKFQRLRYLGILDNDNFHLMSGDLTDSASINRIMEEVRPDEVYHLGAMSFVKESFISPLATMDINAMGTLRVLEAVRTYSISSKVYVAATSEMLGYDKWEKGVPMNENTPFHPRSPYGSSKIAAFYSAQNYREAYNMFICNGILFNHSSELRGEEFVFAKICKGATSIYLKKQEKLELGNIDTYRDVGYSPDYCKAMFLMLQNDIPDDYVVATGKAHSIRDLCEVAFSYYGLNYKDHVVKNIAFMRPSDVGYLLGDSSKARKVLKWKPKVEFKENVHNCCSFWLDKLSKGATGL